MSQASVTSQMRELQNDNRTVVYSGEAFLVEGARQVYELNGQGKLETFGYEGLYDTFSGRFLNDKRQGQATLIKKDDKGKVLLEFEGVFAEDMPEGQGQLILVNHVDDLDQSGTSDHFGLKKQLAIEKMQRRVYQGQFKDGLMDGIGQMECQNKFTYSGQWKEGKPHGHGQCTYTEIDVTYTGMWENGVKCGQGELVYQKSAYTIKGQFKDNMLDGEGTRNYTSGKTLTGTWSENLLVKGKLVNNDGMTYEGDWIGGRPHGNGVKTLTDGKRYEGMFSVGRPWGLGAKVTGEKRTEGYWDRAKFVNQEAPPDKVTEFNEQLQSIRTYYKVFKKFHAKDLPKTSYDCIKEERQELDGFTEQELLERIAQDYDKILSQTTRLEKEFSIAEVGLREPVMSQTMSAQQLAEPDQPLQLGTQASGEGAANEEEKKEGVPIKTLKKSTSVIVSPKEKDASGLSSLDKKKISVMKEMPSQRRLTAINAKQSGQHKSSFTNSQQQKKPQSKLNTDKELSKQDNTSPLTGKAAQAQSKNDGKANLGSFSMTKSQSENKTLATKKVGQAQQKPALTANKMREDRDKSQEKTPGQAGDASTSNFSVVKLQLGGLRNDEVTEDSLVTETDLNTLNTGKVMQAMLEKGDLEPNSKFEGVKDVIDENEELDLNLPKTTKGAQATQDSKQSTLVRITEQRHEGSSLAKGSSAAFVNESSTGRFRAQPSLQSSRAALRGHFVNQAPINEEALLQRQVTSTIQTEVVQFELIPKSQDSKAQESETTADAKGQTTTLQSSQKDGPDPLQTITASKTADAAINREQNQPSKIESQKTIKQTSIRSIKEVKRIGNPMHFNFEAVANETNEETIARVLAFIRDSPDAVENLNDGSIYHGSKLDGKPSGTGFVAVYDDQDQQNSLEQVYLGHFENGKASKYGYLVFDRGQGRYTGEWYDGKYHGKGLFKREWPSETDPSKMQSQLYDGWWQQGDMSGYGMFKWPSGNIYEGEWLANRRHGQGKITDSLGRVRKLGTWKMGKFVPQAK